MKRPPYMLSLAWIAGVIMLIGPTDVIASKGDGVIEPGEEEMGELARSAQNPVANLISVPLQNNANFDFGPREKTQNVLNIQPVVPFELSEDWNLITRTIVPIVSQPSLFKGQDRETGLGDTTFSAFVSPVKPGKLIWGAGPIFLLPTASDDRLGSDKWGIGPSAVFLTMPGNWVLGWLFSQVWSTGGSGDRDVSLFTWQYFVNYNLPGGWYLTSSPIITANWKSKTGEDTWTVPIGGGVGRITKIGALPVNLVAQLYYNVGKPDALGRLNLPVQAAFLFPRRR